MSASTIILLLLLIFIFLGIPQLSLHSYGYYPSGIGAALFVILLVLLISGRI